MRIVASLIATLLAATSAFMVFFPDSGGADPKFNPTGYWAMGLTFGAALTITSLVATLSTLSVRQHSDPAPDRSANRLRDLLTNVLLTMSNRSFRLLTFSASLLFLATVINATLSLHFLTYYAGISSSQSLTLLQLGFALSSLVGVAFWARAAQRIDKHRLYLGATLATALLLASAYMLVGQGRLFGMGNLWPILVGRMLAGFFASALWVLTPSMIADIGDEEELARGQRHEGAFFGVFSLFNQGSTSLALVAAGLLLDHFARLVPGQPTQSPLTIDRLAVLSSWLPAALFLMGAALMGSYRLGRQQVETIQSELNRRAGFQGQRQASNEKETL
jgi:Na+/melibiose symporter-like transporter